VDHFELVRPGRPSFDATPAFGRSKIIESLLDAIQAMWGLRMTASCFMEPKAVIDQKPKFAHAVCLRSG
jgi:hypothetical protein